VSLFTENEVWSEFVEVLRDQGVTLFRCRDCGKWSHAKRRPRRHRRFIANGPDGLLDGYPAHATARDRAEHEGLDVLEEVEPSWNGDPDDVGDPGGVWVACGPFEEWTAIKVEEAHGADGAAGG
jgi:hypothetical protein